MSVVALEDPSISAEARAIAEELGSDFDASPALFEDPHETYYLLEVHSRLDQNSKLERRISELKSGIDNILRRLSKLYESFRQEFSEEVDSSKLNLRNQLITSFVELSKEKLPDIYLRSIPKFGDRCTPLSNALHTALVKMKRLSQRNEGIITIHIPKDVRLRIDGLITDRVQTGFLKPEVLNREVESIKAAIDEIGKHGGVLMRQLRNCVSRNRGLIQQWEDLKRLLRKTQIEEQALKTDFRQKEEEMDDLRREIIRYDEMLQEQRSQFHHEYNSFTIHLSELRRDVGHDIALPVGAFTNSLNEQMKRQEELLANSERTLLEKDIRKRANELAEEFRRRKREIELQGGRAVAQRQKEIEEFDLCVAQLEGKIKSLKRKISLGLTPSQDARRRRGSSSETQQQ